MQRQKVHTHEKQVSISPQSNLWGYKAHGNRGGHAHWSAGCIDICCSV